MENKLGNSVKSKWTYEYYLDGNQKTKTDKNNVITTYKYDLAGRLEKEIKPDWNTIEYKFNRFGNREKMTVSGFENYVTDYVYDKNDNNRLKEETKTKSGRTEICGYEYDANGNQTARRWRRISSTQEPARDLHFVTGRAPGCDVKVDLREYNGFNQLVRVFRDGERTTYRYRPDGLRHSKSVGKAYKSRAEDVTTVQIWDGQNLVMETDGAGNRKSRFLRGVNLIAQQVDEEMRYYLFNAHGDVVQQFYSNTSAFTPEYEYDAFGNQRKASTGDPYEVAADPNPFRYCGEYFDDETQEIYLRARYYNPRTGRFGAEDIARDGLNWYTYCGGNPVAFIDPLGLAKKRNSPPQNENSNPHQGAYDYDTGWYGTGDHAGNWESIYYDDKGNRFALDWDITNEMFIDRDALTLAQITEILMNNNPKLVELGYDAAIYEACQEKGLNPKIILATLATEQNWGLNGEYGKLFGVGPAGRPNSFGADSFGGLYASIDTYMKWYNEGLSMNFPSSIILNQDKNLIDYTAGYVSRNPASRSYFNDGQNVEICNAAMYARMKYNSWLYHPQTEQDGLSYGVSGRGHFATRWQSLALGF